MQIVRVDNLDAFAHRPVVEFFLKAAEENKFSQPEAIVSDLAGMISNPQLGCWVAVDEEGPQAVCVMALPQSAFMEVPQIMLIYGQKRDATKAVVDEALNFGTAAGYTKAWGINRSGQPDEVFERLFGHIGFVRPIGTVLEYEV